MTSISYSSSEFALSLEMLAFLDLEGEEDRSAGSTARSETSTVRTDSAVEEGATSSSPDIYHNAAEKISRFLKKKVRTFKALVEYRTRCIKKHAEAGPKTHTFTVERIPEDHYHYLEVCGIVRAWDKQIGELQRQKGLSESDKIKLSDADEILDRGIAQELHLRRLPGFKQQVKQSCILVAKDGAGKPQAIAHVTRPHTPRFSSMNPEYRIDYLLTAPDNLRLSIQPPGVSGSATAIIEEVAFLSMRHSAQRTVSLKSLPATMSFYEKLGFTHLGDEEFILNKANMLKFLSTCGGIALLNL